jgi:uncharacterized protein
MRALLCFTVLLCTLGFPAWGEPLHSIPRPPRGSWSVDVTRTLSPETISEVNRRGAEVNDEGLGQLAVVMVNTTNGRNPRAYATELFNLWGIGHVGRDDGVLLFIALKDRKAEIVLGSGVNSPEDTRRSDAVMANDIIPAFKRGNPDMAVLAGTRSLSDLLERSPLNASSADITHASATVPVQAVSVPRRVSPPEPAMAGYSVPEASWSWMDLPVWSYWGGAGGLVIGGAGLRRWWRRRPRICQHCRQKRQLLDEDSDDDHLDRGQRREESLGSVDYDVWWCESCADAQVERYGAVFTSYSTCPRCDYKTKSESTTTLVSATYDHGGRVRVTVNCKQCGYHNEFTRSTPKLTRPSSSSGGSSSFGGGRSSGGGSSGSW